MTEFIVREANEGNEPPGDWSRPSRSTKCQHIAYHAECEHCVAADNEHDMMCPMHPRFAEAMGYIVCTCAAIRRFGDSSASDPTGGCQNISGTQSDKSGADTTANPTSP